MSNQRLSEKEQLIKEVAEIDTQTQQQKNLLAYKKKTLDRQLSPERADEFSNNQSQGRSYKDIAKQQMQENQKVNQIEKKKVNEKENFKQQQSRFSSEEATDASRVLSNNRKSKWDTGTTPARVGGLFGETPTPGQLVQNTPLGSGRFGQTPSRFGVAGSKRFGETPTPGRSTFMGNWSGQTPQIGQTPGLGMTPSQTPGTPSLSAEQIVQLRALKDIEEKNRPMTDEELDKILPGIKEGYEVIKPPTSYKPLQTNTTRKIIAQQVTPQMTPLVYDIPQTPKMNSNQFGAQTPGSALPSIKAEDLGHFGQLLNEVNESELTQEEYKERKIMMLLLKIKNGTPQMRKSAMRHITCNARDFGAKALFNQILPLLMSSTLEDQERHLLVKVIDRILYKLDDLVRPYVHKILVVIEPMLIDEDYYARIEGKEIISNLAKAAGLATMTTIMKPDIDNNDEYVRNTTARAFAVVASSLGIPALQPFLKAVCMSKKNWMARHTGIKIVQQISILMGVGILPHLNGLVNIIEHGLYDEQPKVRTITALALAALAEAANPYGIEAFKNALESLWQGVRSQTGRSLAAILKAIGYIIPLMNPQHAKVYIDDIVDILKQQFKTQEIEMKKIILKVIKQCISCSGIDGKFVRSQIVPDFFKHYWVRSMATDRRNYKQLIDTTIEISQKVGGALVIDKIIIGLKDDNEPYRKMVMEVIEKIVSLQGISDVDQSLERQLMDGIIGAFHEQISDDSQVMLNGFGAVVNALGIRAKKYFYQIIGIIQWRLNNKSAKVRQQAADLISRIAICMKNCGEEISLGKLGVLLYENLGEEYPDVLGSILGGLKAIVNVIGMSKMTPPIKDLLPSLTPILKNRNEKVQENIIDLIGRIADRGSEYVSPKEWMRICFDLLDLLKAHKKGIRRATVNTFGYIANAIGPQDVLVTLLNHLKVQERQLRICTTVAIAIVSETCGPFTVLPALMNEYRVQELNVQNGVLKSLSFMFEYIGEMSKDYIYAVSTLLEDALSDRDLVHRQTATSAVKHLALGVAALGCEDALYHLFNYVFPNIFEISPHIISAVTDCIEAMRVSLGPGVVLLYLLQGLFHPAKRVRVVYWRIYNMLYVGSQDALTPFLPELENDKYQNNYKRDELYMMI